MPDQRETPKKYQRLLTKLGGLNILGEPAFILQWGLSPIRRYAVPDDFLGPYLNKWVLAEWTAPEEFGTPAEVEALGVPFPSRGLYLPLFVYDRIDSEELNLEVLRTTLHIVMTHKYDTLQHRYHVMKDEYAKVKAEETRVLVDRIEDGAPAFLDATCFHGQRNCNSVVKQKLEYLEKNIGKITDAARRFPRSGMMQKKSAATFDAAIKL